MSNETTSTMTTNIEKETHEGHDDNKVNDTDTIHDGMFTLLGNGSDGEITLPGNNTLKENMTTAGGTSEESTTGVTMLEGNTMGVTSGISTSDGSSTLVTTASPPSTFTSTGWTGSTASGSFSTPSFTSGASMSTASFSSGGTTLFTTVLGEQDSPAPRPTTSTVPIGGSSSSSQSSPLYTSSSGTGTTSAGSSDSPDPTTLFEVKPTEAASTTAPFKSTTAFETPSERIPEVTTQPLRDNFRLMMDEIDWPDALSEVPEKFRKSLKSCTNQYGEKINVLGFEMGNSGADPLMCFSYKNLGKNDLPAAESIVSIRTDRLRVGAEGEPDTILPHYLAWLDCVSGALKGCQRSTTASEKSMSNETTSTMTTNIEKETHEGHGENKVNDTDTIHDGAFTLLDNGSDGEITLPGNNTLKENMTTAGGTSEESTTGVTMLEGNTMGVTSGISTSDGSSTLVTTASPPSTFTSTGWTGSTASGSFSTPSFTSGASMSTASFSSGGTTLFTTVMGEQDSPAPRPTTSTVPIGGSSSSSQSSPLYTSSSGTGTTSAGSSDSPDPTTLFEVKPTEAASTTAPFKSTTAFETPSERIPEVTTQPLRDNFRLMMDEIDWPDALSEVPEKFRKSLKSCTNQYGEKINVLGFEVGNSGADPLMCFSYKNLGKNDLPAADSIVSIRTDRLRRGQWWMSVDVVVRDYAIPIMVKMMKLQYPGTNWAKEKVDLYYLEDTPMFTNVMTQMGVVLVSIGDHAVPSSLSNAVITKIMDEKYGDFPYILECYIYSGIPDHYMSTLVWSHNEFMASILTCVTLGSLILMVMIATIVTGVRTTDEDLDEQEPSRVNEVDLSEDAGGAGVQIKETELLEDEQATCAKKIGSEHCDEDKTSNDENLTSDTGEPTEAASTTAPFKSTTAFETPSERIPEVTTQPLRDNFRLMMDEIDWPDALSEVPEKFRKSLKSCTNQYGEKINVLGFEMGNSGADPLMCFSYKNLGKNDLPAAESIVSIRTDRLRRGQWWMSVDVVVRDYAIPIMVKMMKLQYPGTNWYVIEIERRIEGEVETLMVKMMKLQYPGTNWAKEKVDLYYLEDTPMFTNVMTQMGVVLVSIGDHAVPSSLSNAVITKIMDEKYGDFPYILECYIYSGIPDHYMSTLVWSHNEFMASILTCVTLGSLILMVMIATIVTGVRTTDEDLDEQEPSRVNEVDLSEDAGGAGVQIKETELLEDEQATCAKKIGSEHCDEDKTSNDENLVIENDLAIEVEEKTATDAILDNFNITATGEEETSELI
eukprot:sb/3461131/